MGTNQRLADGERETEKLPWNEGRGETFTTEKKNRFVKFCNFRITLVPTALIASLD